jgi:hypothetical protein
MSLRVRKKYLPTGLMVKFDAQKASFSIMYTGGMQVPMKRTYSSHLKKAFWYQSAPISTGWAIARALKDTESALLL